MSRHLCWDTCPHYTLNFSNHFSKKQLLLRWSCRYSSQHQSLVTSLCPESRPKQWISHERTHMMRREEKKDWNCSEMHFCSENICILCGGHAQKKEEEHFVFPALLTWYGLLRCNTALHSCLQFNSCAREKFTSKSKSCPRKTTFSPLSLWSKISIQPIHWQLWNNIYASPIGFNDGHFFHAMRWWCFIFYNDAIAIIFGHSLPSPSLRLFFQTIGIDYLAMFV